MHIKKIVRFSTLLLVLGTAACASSFTVKEVRDQPARFSMTVPAPRDRTGLCIAAFYTNGGYQSAYAPAVGGTGTEVVVWETPAKAGTVLYVFDVAGDGQTTVTYRERPGLGNGSERQARETTARCGKA